MFGTDLNFEPTTRTFYVHVSASERKTRVYRQRPSRQRRLFAALRAQTGR
jgi:hypothetical protein